MRRHSASESTAGPASQNTETASQPMARTMSLAPKTGFTKEKTHFTFKVKSSSLSCGSLGGAGTLDVLYEDPEEDLLSTFSEDDQRRLITDDDSSDEVFSSSNPDTLDQTQTAWNLLEEEISDIFLLMNKCSFRLLVRHDVDNMLW